MSIGYKIGAVALLIAALVGWHWLDKRNAVQSAVEATKATMNAEYQLKREEARKLAEQNTKVLQDEKDIAFFRKIIPAYAFILNKHLKDEATSNQLFEVIEIDHHNHRPNQVAKIMFQKINDLYASKKISGDQLIILNNEFQSFTEICGACERIKNTPIPYSYSAFIKKFIFFYIMTLPFGYAFSLGFYVIPVVVFIFYVLASLELIAEEIEDPFGNDDNDLPTHKIASNIKKHVEEIL